jgi:hypothetical protein
MARIVIQIDATDVNETITAIVRDGVTEGQVGDLGLSSRPVQGAALDAGRAPSGPPEPRIESSDSWAEPESIADAGRAPTDPRARPNT